MKQGVLKEQNYQDLVNEIKIYTLSWETTLCSKLSSEIIFAMNPTLRTHINL